MPKQNSVYSFGVSVGMEDDATDAMALVLEGLHVDSELGESVTVKGYQIDICCTLLH